MLKRGQVTIFILVGLFLLFVVIGATYLRNYMIITDATIEEKEPLVTQPIVDFITACLEKSTSESLLFVLAQGGYSTFPIELETASWMYEGGKKMVPIYFDGKKSKIPGINMIERQVGKLAEEKFMECIASFNLFTKEGYAFNYNSSNISVHFMEKKTKVEMDFPLEIVKSSQKKEMKTFSSTLLFSVLNEYNSIKQYLLNQEQDATYLLLGDLSSKLTENNVLLTFKQEGGSGERVFVNAIFPMTISGKELKYNFGLDFKWEGELQQNIQLEKIKESFLVDQIDPWVITSQGIFTSQIKAEGNNLSYAIDPPDLMIDQKGIVTLNIIDFLNDEYVYYVIVTDGDNNTRVEPLYIFINIDKPGYPVFSNISKQFGKVGTQYTFKVPLSNPKLGTVTFKSDSTLFLINQSSGLISFIPRKEDRGYHSIRVDASNKNGRTWKRWEMVIS